MPQEQVIKAVTLEKLPEITRDAAVWRAHKNGNRFTLPADFVLALTGYHPDLSLLVGLGVAIHHPSGAPVYDPDTMETGVQGLSLGGSLRRGLQREHLNDQKRTVSRTDVRRPFGT